MDDDALMALAAAGDTRAFGRLVRTHQARLVRFAARLLGDREAAEDAAQEAFLRLWRARERYQPKGNLGGYLLCVVRSVCLDHLRARRPTASLDRDCPLDIPSERTADRCEARAVAEAARRAVLSLPEPQREVFILSHYEGLSYREIAETLGCPLGTVASRKALAVETLRRRLRPWTEENERV